MSECGGGGVEVSGQGMEWSGWLESYDSCSVFVCIDLSPQPHVVPYSRLVTLTLSMYVCVQVSIQQVLNELINPAI